MIQSSDLRIQKGRSAEPAKGGVRLTLLIRGLDDESESVLKTGATVLLDHTVGEYDAGTKVAELDAGPLPDPPPAGAFPLSGEHHGQVQRLVGQRLVELVELPVGGAPVDRQDRGG